MHRHLGFMGNRPELRGQLSVLPPSIWRKVADPATGNPVTASPHALRLGNGETIVLGKVVRRGQLDLVLVECDGTMDELQKAGSILRTLGITNLSDIRPGPIGWFSTEGEHESTLHGLRAAAKVGAEQAPILWFRRKRQTATLAA